MVCKTFIIQFLFFCLDLHLFCSYWFSNFQIIGVYRVFLNFGHPVLQTHRQCVRIFFFLSFQRKKVQNIYLVLFNFLFWSFGWISISLFLVQFGIKKDNLLEGISLFFSFVGIQKMTPLTIFWERKKGLTRVRDLDKSGLFSETDPYKKFSPFM